ncbi:MAG TPA: TonB-dependent receptor [Puia sp.]|nr:TonB-dependent receptor [Puia sp.]
MKKYSNGKFAQTAGDAGKAICRAGGIWTALFLLMGFAAESQEKTTSLDSVVVTAQKREELLKHVPFSVSAITARQVREYRLWNNKDITAIVPNLYAADPGDGRDVISVRGITTTSYDPAVAVNIDGVNQFGLDTYIPSLLDVERIEVLRGPQGTLYGRNAMGGVINIITRQPGALPSAFGEISLGNHGQQRYSAGFSAPLVKNKLFIGIAGLYEGRKGYYTNQFTNSDYDRQHAFTGNYYLKWLAGSRWLVDLNIKHRNGRNNGAFPLVADPVMAFSEPFVLDQNAIATMVDNTFNSSLAINYKGRAYHFTAQTAYQSNNRYYTGPIDGDFSPLDAITVLKNYGVKWNKIKVLTEDLRFTSAAGSSSPWKWTVGSYWFYQDDPNKQGTRYGNDANLLGVGDSLFTTISTTKYHKWGTALYGQLGYALSKKMNLTAGLRYDYEHQSMDVLGEYQHDPGPDPFVVRPDTSGNVSFHAVSPKLSLDYRVSAGTMFYIVYSRGFRTGGLTPLSSDPSQPPLVGFRPEYSSNYEAGVKTGWWNNALRLNADIFYTHINNAQVPTLVLPDAITITKNAGKLNNWGGEAELSATPVQGLNIVYTFGYTHSRFADLKLSENGSSVDLAGKRQVFTPDLTSLLAVQYSRPVTGQWQAVIRGEWKSIGTTYFDLNNQISQSPYNLFNVRAGVESGQLELMFWGRNIGNKRYLSYAYDFGAFHLGDPATWGLSVFIRVPGR